MTSTKLCVTLLFVAWLSSTESLRLPPSAGKMRAKDSLTALAAVAIVSLPLPTLALTLDTATTMMTAVICDNSGRCTRPASKPQTAPTDLAETMKNEAAAQR